MSKVASKRHGHFPTWEEVCQHNPEDLDIFAKTEYAVEADAFARRALEIITSERITWEENVPKVMYIFEIGHIHGRPINVQCTWAKLNGHLIMFYTGVNSLVDWNMIEDWLKVRLPKDACKGTRYERGRLRRFTAENFKELEGLIGRRGA